MRFVLLLIAAVVAVAAGVAALQLSGKNSTPAPAAASGQSSESSNVTTVDVLVARQAIPMGTVIDDSMIDKQPWPEHLVLDGFVVSGSKDANITGRVARTELVAHEPFNLAKLANPNDPNFLAAALPSGMRAVTIATDAITGIAGYVFPGDRVDVVFVHNLPQTIKADRQGGTGRNDKPAVTEVLVPNVRVMAINVREANNKTQGAMVPSSVTVEVDEADVQRMRLAEKVGVLSLSLRSLKDKDNNSLPDPTVLSQLTRVHMMQSQGGEEPVRIIHGAGSDADAAAPPKEFQMMMMPQTAPAGPIPDVSR